MKKLTNILLIIFAPFIFTWMVFLLTAFAFDIRSFFTSSVFIGITIFYYFIVGIIVETLFTQLD